jgi:hypothetical protein
MTRTLLSLAFLLALAGTAAADAAPPPPPAETMLKWLKDGCTFANARRTGEVCEVCFMQEGFEGSYCAFPEDGEREPASDYRDYGRRCQSAATERGSYEIHCRRAEPCEELKVARPGEECERCQSNDCGFYAKRGYERRCASRVRQHGYTLWCKGEKPASKPTTSTTPETAPPTEATLAGEARGGGCRVGGAIGGGGALLLLGLVTLLRRRR